MKIAVIGLGSMGKRRIRLLKQIDGTLDIVGVAANPQRRREAEEQFGIPTVADPDGAAGVSCAFVCASPLAHASIINDCLGRGWHVFTELNLVSDRYEENMALAEEKGLTLFLSSTFLYRDEVRYISDRVQEQTGGVNYTYHIGQYLPDWHPWQSYKSFFVGDRRSNGCREIMAVELPWLTTVFGPVTDFHAVSSRLTGLAIDYPDCYMLQLTHASGAQGMLTVDIVSRKAVRNLEVFGEELYLSWDGSPAGLYRYDIQGKKNDNIALYESVDKQAGYSASIIENAYRAEIETFLAQVRGGTPAPYGFAQDKAVLALIDRIEGV